MGTLLLIRHGQANSAATDDASYDRLSDLGRRQARRLGAWLRAHEAPFDHVETGTLARQRGTAEAMGLGPGPDPIRAGWDELDYFTLSAALEAATGIPHPGADDFASHAPRLLDAWHRAEIRGRETFAGFEARVTEALAQAARPDRRTCVVTSGGVIGLVLRHVLGLDMTRMAAMMLPIWNTSIHRFEIGPQGPLLTGYNHLPHLPDPAERSHY